MQTAQPIPRRSKDEQAKNQFIEAMTTWLQIVAAARAQAERAAQTADDKKAA